MNINKYTEKAQEAIAAAQRIAEQSSHAQIEPEMIPRSGGKSVNGRARARKRRTAREFTAATGLVRTGETEAAARHRELARQPLC